MNPDTNTNNRSRKFGPYNIELSSDECLFLYYMTNLMMSAFKGIQYDRSTGIDLDKISMRHGVDYLGQIIDVVNKTIEDAVGKDQEKAKKLLESITKKITAILRTIQAYSTGLRTLRTNQIYDKSNPTRPLKR
jgi:hypothetical protein